MSLQHAPVQPPESRSSTPAVRPKWVYAGRADAGRQLAAVFDRSLHPDAVVIGLASGGIVAAAELARSLDAALDVACIAELHEVQQPHRVIGAVAQTGEAVLLEERRGVAEPAAVQSAQAECAALDAMLHLDFPRINPTGREVILVDDAITDGLALLAAAKWAFNRGASRVTVGAPVASVEGLRRVLCAVTEAVTLHVTPDGPALSDWYRRLPEVSAGVVVELIARGRGDRPGTTPSDRSQTRRVS
jgi:putative phosphoribosyl transferase